jgi:hypothetical protein
MEIVWQAEDSLREKKSESDLKDLLKTLVAFANSVAPGDTAKIFIGEQDDGAVQGVTDADNIQKRVKKEADKIYPEIYFKTEVYEREGKQCVRVDIKHNGLAPHFGGAAWVRKGSETVRATAELYQQLVDMRQSKIQVLAKWLNQDATVEGIHAKAYFAGTHHSYEWSAGVHQATLQAVNIHWVTFKVIPNLDNAPFEKSEPMEKLLLGWDDDRNRLKVLVRDWSR